MSTSGGSGYIRATDLARSLGVSIHTIMRRIKDGTIKTGRKRKVGVVEMWVIDRDEASDLSREVVVPTMAFRAPLEAVEVREDSDCEMRTRMKALGRRLSVLEHVMERHDERQDMK